MDTELAGPVVLLKGCPHASWQAPVVHGGVQGRGCSPRDRFRRTISEVARELGIDPGMLSVWVNDEQRRITAAEVHGDTPLEAAERAELQRLRRQVTELEKDNAFLVEASAYFAAMQKNRPGSL